MHPTPINPPIPKSATYYYVASSPLVDQNSFTNNGTLRMTTTRQNDYLNGLLRVSSAPSAASALSFSYPYNAASQRTATGHWPGEARRAAGTGAAEKSIGAGL